MMNRNFARNLKQLPSSVLTPSKRRRRFRISVFFSLLIFFICIGILLFRPNLLRIMRQQCSLTIQEQLAEAVLEVLAQQQNQSIELVSFIRDQEGRIIAVETNTQTANRLKSQLNRRVSDRLKNLESVPFYLPLGTLLGNEFLAGQGPAVPFHVVPVGTLSSDFISTFESVGINQTKHQIDLVLEVEVEAAIPFFHIAANVQSHFIISETVIVGEVPEYYTQISGENGDLSYNGIDPLDLR